MSGRANQEPSVDAGRVGRQDKILVSAGGHNMLDVGFRIRVQTKMERVKRLYSQIVGMNVNSLRFIFEGRPILDDDTATTLGMEDNDVIEVHHVRRPFQDLSNEIRLHCSTRVSSGLFSATNPRGL